MQFSKANEFRSWLIEHNVAANTAYTYSRVVARALAILPEMTSPAIRALILSPGDSLIFPTAWRWLVAYGETVGKPLPDPFAEARVAKAAARAAAIKVQAAPTLTLPGPLMKSLSELLSFGIAPEEIIGLDPSKPRGTGKFPWVVRKRKGGELWCGLSSIGPFLDWRGGNYSGPLLPTEPKGSVPIGVPALRKMLREWRSVNG